MNTFSEQLDVALANADSATEIAHRKRYRYLARTQKIYSTEGIFLSFFGVVLAVAALYNIGASVITVTALVLPLMYFAGLVDQICAEYAFMHKSLKVTPHAALTAVERVKVMNMCKDAGASEQQWLTLQKMAQREDVASGWWLHVQSLARLEVYKQSKLLEQENNQRLAVQQEQEAQAVIHSATYTSEDLPTIVVEQSNSAQAPIKDDPTRLLV